MKRIPVTEVWKSHVFGSNYFKLRTSARHERVSTETRLEAIQFDIQT